MVTIIRRPVPLGHGGAECCLAGGLDPAGDRGSRLQPLSSPNSLPSDCRAPGLFLTKSYISAFLGHRRFDENTASSLKKKKQKKSSFALLKNHKIKLKIIFNSQTNAPLLACHTFLFFFPSRLVDALESTQTSTPICTQSTTRNHWATDTERTEIWHLFFF